MKKSEEKPLITQRSKKMGKKRKKTFLVTNFSEFNKKLFQFAFANLLPRSKERERETTNFGFRYFFHFIFIFW
jgi:hypothetical protein